MGERGSDGESDVEEEGWEKSKGDKCLKKVALDPHEISRNATGVRSASGETAAETMLNFCQHVQF